MPKIMIQHEVGDYDRWKGMFDAGAPVRNLNGEKGHEIFRNPENLNDVTILFEWDDVKKIMRFSQSEELRVVMEQSGVIGKPNLYVQEKDLES